MSEFIPLPAEQQDIDARIAEGWLPAFPPNDYSGNISDWCVAMAEAGYPEDYSLLTCIMIPEAVYTEILEWCES